MVRWSNPEVERMSVWAGGSKRQPSPGCDLTTRTRHAATELGVRLRDDDLGQRVEANGRELTRRKLEFVVPHFNDQPIGTYCDQTERIFQAIAKPNVHGQAELAKGREYSKYGIVGFRANLDRQSVAQLPALHN